jgi:hypothetical protein
MLGWHITVYRQTHGGASPATAESPPGKRLAVWQTGLGGLDWINELVKNGEAINLGGNGYPCRFTATAKHLIPAVINKPPGARDAWTCGESDVLTEEWEGKTVIDRCAAAGCSPDEWLLVEAWDES